jgi:ABC-type lipoprotein export system ATPase subunit
MRELRQVSGPADSRGSIWRRWDPHIHTPGTIMNDQFGPGAWEGYLTRIETSEPRIEALGVTDYCSLDRYVEMLTHVAAGRLSDVHLLFPNVELRLPVETAATKPVNIHLLFSPDQPDHVEQARRFLRGLKFAYLGEQYACEREDLIRLGRKHKPELVEDNAALEAGTNQFKVTPDALKAALESSLWAQENIVIAVAGGSNDGTSGLRSQDASMEATRVEIERMSNIIFSSQPAQRVFWLGEGAAAKEQIESKWGGVKACMHGSDAHDLDAVGNPDDNRYTWIKGDATFESLRQACIEPGERVIVAESPPEGALDYRTIKSLAVAGADWLSTPDLALNRGLVAVIGARGSGKTALTDLIAAASNAASADRTSNQSFLRRAEGHLNGLRLTLAWADGSAPGTTLPMGNADGEPPRVQYLSQQFVEQLCSSEGITDELLAEIERVIFEAHAYESRLGAATFHELLDLKAGPGRLKRQHAHEDIDGIARKIETEREASAGLVGLKTKLIQVQTGITADKTARQGLISRGGEERAEQLGRINLALTILQAKVEALTRKKQALDALAAEVENLKIRRLPSIKTDLVTAHASAGLTEHEWSQFDLAFEGKPQDVVQRRLTEATLEIATLNGPVVLKPSAPIQGVTPFIPAGITPSQATLNALRAEAWRLGELIGLDAARSKQLTDLNAKINQAESQAETLKEQIATAEGASGRIALLIAQRKDAYAAIFDGFAEEEAQLAGLYAPLGTMLAEQTGTLGKLSFTVRRIVDAETWARQGESLLDLRTTGRFRGHGELLKVVREELLPAWASGTSAEVATAMAKFREAHDGDIIEHARASRTDPVGYRQWGAQIAEWLNGTEHISVQYGVQYDGVDIEQLSPGTRGIVLLLLYLSVDALDDRPLIIDQPEENLDPKSIFDELVHRFRSARMRRQIIIVTHNANLVVNTDADQVIVASAGAHRPGHLPEITYTSGGLENPAIREQVCEILEGGRRAFEERARRFRFKLN